MTTQLCTQADMERILASYGVREYADHDDNGVIDTGVLDDCIDQASGEVLIWLGQRYSVASLAAQSLVVRWTATVACYFLTTRRGNPPPTSLEAEFHRLMDFPEGLLPLIGTGRVDLNGVSLKANLTPSMSNVTLDRRYRQSKIRVTQPNSTQQPSVLPRNIDNSGYYPNG